MTKSKSKPEEGTPLAESSRAAQAPSDWNQVATAWADKANTPVVAERLERELAQVGIFTVEELASAPINLIASAARAAIQADAQALRSAANKVLQGGSS